MDQLFDPVLKKTTCVSKYKNIKTFTILLKEHPKLIIVWGYR
jgi:hypothetical protein